jgi:hypothetical protein
LPSGVALCDGDVRPLRGYAGEESTEPSPLAGIGSNVRHDLGHTDTKDQAGGTATRPEIGQQHLHRV